MWLLEVEKHLSVNLSVESFHFLNIFPIVPIVSPSNLTAMSYSNLPIFSLYEEFSFIETTLFSHTYFISLYVVWWSYLITVTTHRTQPWEEKSGPQEHPASHQPDRTLSREWAAWSPERTERTEGPGNHWDRLRKIPLQDKKEASCVFKS